LASLRDIARATSLSVATVSRALRSDPSVQGQTQRRVAAAAKRLGYRVNPYVGHLMSSLRRSRGEHHKGNLALIWFDGFDARESHPNFLIMRKAIFDRAEELGYSLDEFSRNDYTPKALRSILNSRGIRGLLISPPVNAPGKTHLRIDMSGLTGVSLGWAILHPALNSVRFDHYASVRIALHHARHRFGSRIAGIWSFEADRRADHVRRAAFLAHHPAGPALADTLFLDAKQLHSARTKTLFRQHRIECLLSDSEELPAWIHALVPPKRCIYLSPPRPQACLARVDPRYDLLGRWGIDLLSSTLQRNEYGIPETQKTMQVPGTWTPSEASQRQM